MERFQFGLDGERLTALTYTPRRPVGATLLLGHGTSGGQKSPFVMEYANALAQRGVLVVTFDFPFMARGRRAPDPYEKLSAAFRSAVRAAWECRPKNRLFVGGKSLGGRVATLAMIEGGDELELVSGVVVLGYPLHRMGGAGASRARHLQRLPVPALFVQGTRDVFGTPAELRRAVGGSSEIYPVEGADHSLVVRGEDLHGEIADEIVRWILETPERVAAPRSRPIASRLRTQIRQLRKETHGNAIRSRARAE